MKPAAVVFLVVLVAGFAFFLGRTTASDSNSPTTSSVSVTASSPVAASAKIVATQADRELMSALNAVQSAVQTGVNSGRYSELIATARTKLADLKLYSANSPIALPAAAYLEAHTMILSMWTHYMGRESHIFINEEVTPELFALIKVAVPNIEPISSSSSAKTYDLSSVGMLWDYTEAKLWPKIAAGWQTFGQ
jgi:hypothetical protein